MLVAYVGGMSTTFPGTSTVESYFSVIGWKKDEYRTMLSNLSLEGILHSKQKQEIQSIKTLLNKLTEYISNVPTFSTFMFRIFPQSS